MGEQMKVRPVSTDFGSYVDEVEKELEKMGIDFMAEDDLTMDGIAHCQEQGASPLLTAELCRQYLVKVMGRDIYNESKGAKGAGGIRPE